MSKPIRRDTRAQRRHFQVGIWLRLGGSLVALCASVLMVAVRPAPAQPADPTWRSASGPTTCVITRRNGKLVGCVVRIGKRYWEGNAGALISIDVNKKGAYMIYENESWLNYAYPNPRGQQNRYVARSGEIFRKVSATRWNVFRRGRLIAFTRGPDGVPAALAFVTGEWNLDAATTPG